MEFLKMRRGEERVVEVIFKILLSLQKIITFMMAEVMRVGELFLKEKVPTIPSQVMRVSGDGQRVVIYTPGSSRSFSSLCLSIVS